MSHRFFHERPLGGDLRARLEGDEARHLSKVLRKKTGEDVLLFDGTGWEYRGRIETIRRESVELTILASWQSAAETIFPIHLGVSPPKGDRQKWMIEKLTELGCAELLPLATEFQVAKTDADVLRRLRRQVVEASKQCGRSKLMRIAEETNIENLSAVCDCSESEPVRLILHPKSAEDCGQKTLGTCLDEVFLKRKSYPSCYALVGPEGGFAPGEIRTALRHGWQPVDLGPGILRVETAAVALCAVLSLYAPNFSVRGDPSGA